MALERRSIKSFLAELEVSSFQFLEKCKNLSKTFFLGQSLIPTEIWLFKLWRFATASTKYSTFFSLLLACTRVNATMQSDLWPFVESQLKLFSIWSEASDRWAWWWREYLLLPMVSSVTDWIELFYAGESTGPRSVFLQVPVQCYFPSKSSEEKKNCSDTFAVIDETFFWLFLPRFMVLFLYHGFFFLMAALPAAFNEKVASKSKRIPFCFLLLCSVAMVGSVRGVQLMAEFCSFSTPNHNRLDLFQFRWWSATKKKVKNWRQKINTILQKCSREDCSRVTRLPNCSWAKFISNQILHLIFGRSLFVSSFISALILKHLLPAHVGLWLRTLPKWEFILEI